MPFPSLSDLIYGKEEKEKKEKKSSHSKKRKSSLKSSFAKTKKKKKKRTSTPKSPSQVRFQNDTDIKDQEDDHNGQNQHQLEEDDDYEGSMLEKNTNKKTNDDGPTRTVNTDDQSTAREDDNDIMKNSESLLSVIYSRSDDFDNNSNNGNNNGNDKKIQTATPPLQTEDNNNNTLLFQKYLSAPVIKSKLSSATIKSRKRSMTREERLKPRVIIKKKRMFSSTNKDGLELTTEHRETQIQAQLRVDKYEQMADHIRISNRWKRRLYDYTKEEDVGSSLQSMAKKRLLKSIHSQQQKQQQQQQQKTERSNCQSSSHNETEKPINNQGEDEDENQEEEDEDNLPASQQSQIMKRLSVSSTSKDKNNEGQKGKAPVSTDQARLDEFRNRSYNTFKFNYWQRGHCKPSKRDLEFDYHNSKDDFLETSTPAATTASNILKKNTINNTPTTTDINNSMVEKKFDDNHSSASSSNQVARKITTPTAANTVNNHPNQGHDSKIERVKHLQNDTDGRRRSVETEQLDNKKASKASENDFDCDIGNGVVQSTGWKCFFSREVGNGLKAGFDPYYVFNTFPHRQQFFPVQKRHQLLHQRQLRRMVSRILCSNSSSGDITTEQKVFENRCLRSIQTVERTADGRPCTIRNPHLNHRLHLKHYFTRVCGSDLVWFLKHEFSDPYEVACRLGLISDNYTSRNNNKHYLVGWPMDYTTRQREYQRMRKTILTKFKKNQLSQKKRKLTTTSDTNAGKKRFSSAKEDAPSADAVIMNQIINCASSTSDHSMTVVDENGTDVTEENKSPALDEAVQKLTNADDPSILIPPTCHYVHVAGTVPPTPEVAASKHAGGTNVVLFGPSDRYAHCYHTAKIDLTAYNLTVSTLLRRIHTSNAPNLKDQKSLKLFVETCPTKIHHSNHYKLMDKRSLVGMKEVTRFRFYRGDVPLVAYGHSMMGYCSFIINNGISSYPTELLNRPNNDDLNSYVNSNSHITARSKRRKQSMKERLRQENGTMSSFVKLHQELSDDDFNKSDDDHDSLYDDENDDNNKRQIKPTNSSCAMMENFVVRMNVAADELWNFCEQSQVFQLRSGAIEFHNGLLRFPKLRKIIALAGICKRLPHEAAEIFSQPTYQWKTKSEADDTNKNNHRHVRTPVELVQQTLEFLEEKDYLVKEDDDDFHAGKTICDDDSFDSNSRVHSGELEYILHQAADAFYGCIQLDPVSVDYHLWYIASLAGCLLLCSGNRIGSGARLYPSGRTPEMTRKRRIRRSTGAFSFLHTISRNSIDYDDDDYNMTGDTNEDENNAIADFEVRCPLYKYEEVRKELASAVRFLLLLAKHQKGPKAYLAVASFLEWRQVVTLLVGGDNQNGGGDGVDEKKELSSSLKDIGTLHKYHVDYWLLLDESPFAKAYAMHTELLPKCTSSKSNDISLSLLARKLENDPGTLDNWKEFVHTLGPIGSTNAELMIQGEHKKGKGTRFMSSSYKCTCKECKRLKRGRTIDHDDRLGRRQNGKWWGMGRDEWWFSTLLQLPSSPTIAASELAATSLQMVLEALERQDIIEESIPFDDKNTSNRVSESYAANTNGRRSHLSTVKMSYEKLSSWLPYNGKAKTTERNDDGSDSDQETDIICRRSREERLETFDSHLPKTFVEVLSENKSEEDEVVHGSTSDKVCDKDSLLEGFNKLNIALQLICYKVVIVCHLHGVCHPCVEATIWNLLKIALDKGGAVDNCDEFRSILWLSSMGLNTSQILRETCAKGL